MIHSCCLNNELKNVLFSYLSDEELQRIDANIFCTSYKLGDLIFKYGTPQSHIVFLTQGFVKIYKEATTNKKLILSIAKSVNYISGPGIFYGGINHYSVEALSECKTCFIDKEVFLEIVFTNRKFASCFFEEFSMRAVRTMNNFVDITHMNMEGRIAKLLLFLSKDIYQKEAFDLLLSRQDIADYCAMTKESAIRILKTFEKENIIKLNGNLVEIVDAKKLDFFMSLYKPKS